MTDLLAARSQMAVSLAFHIVFAVIGIGTPVLLPPDLSYVTAAAPAITLKLVLLALFVGALVLIPSLYYLFRIFKGRPT